MTANSLLPCLARLAQLQHESIDRLALQEAAAAAGAASDPSQQLETVASHLQVAAPRWLQAPDPAVLPVLVRSPAGEWGVLRARNSQGQWVSEWWDEGEGRWCEQAHDALPDHVFAAFRLAAAYRAGRSPVLELIRREVLAQKSLLRDAVLGGVTINMVAITTSFYTMQVYDRVVPTGASQTLLVLTLGVLGAVVFEFFAKRIRTGIYERLIDGVDQRLARTIYMRFLSIRLDQLPRSVGGLAAQMRGYETVRGFFSAVTTSLLVDAPFALLYAVVIAAIAGWLAAIPAVFLALSVAIGWSYRKQVESHASAAIGASNFKTGLLVESVEGAETIKSGQGGWRMLSRWMAVSDEARGHEVHMRNLGEHAQHLTAAFQQFSYVLVVASGALLISRGELTMGGLIACSILSGRVLGPVAMIPSQMVQWAHAKAALQGLDRLWALEDDHHGQEQPVVLEKVRGQYRFEAVQSDYDGIRALAVQNLVIAAGEKVGVLGPVGAGKTTLLRLLSGMYKPQQGRILLDDVDLAHIAKPVLAECMGYLPQDGRLFSGSLRDNLLLGLLDPGDEAILEAARRTGLMQSVLAKHPKGLQQPIFEGGTGLSGGQRQLVNLTRVFLRRPGIWLLDEPTASMDRNLELQVIQALAQSVRPADTLVLVTHKAELLALVDRVILVIDRQVVADGPKELILRKLETQQAEPRRKTA